MEVPKAIFFDFGNTVFHETGFYPDIGNQYLLSLSKNAYNVTIDDINECKKEFDETIQKMKHLSNIEHSWVSYTKILFEKLGINVKTNKRVEIEYWRRCEEGYIPKDFITFLKYIKKRKIKSGILSNNIFSGSAIISELKKNRIQKYFDLVMTSADYGIRKPLSLFFELARDKLKLKSEEVWFIGDKLDKDYNPSKSIGMIPFLYVGAVCDENEQQEVKNKFSNWSEIIELIEDCR
jgi:putative hydrolase of the HAD superfamily